MIIPLIDCAQLCVVIESASMLQIPHRYRINAPQTIFEMFEDEIIIVSFFDGSYYSVRDSAAALWQAIHTGASTQHIIDAFVTAYPAEATHITTSLDRFLSELERARLIVPAEDSVNDHPLIDMPVSTTGFQPPVLERYTDMQDLLLLDPIHDVDDMGWPQKAPDTQPGRA